MLWGILAVPTGIVIAEMSTQRRMQMMQATTTRTCHECLTEGHAADANFCPHCGAKLPSYQNDSRAPEAPASTGAT